jgi:hypothetical protein
MPQSYTEGQRLLGSDGQIYIVRGGVPTLEGGSTDVSRIVAPSPVRIAKEAQDRARQDEADARARRDQSSQEEKDRRAALEWQATHNPDGSKKADPADANNPQTAAVRSAALQKYNAARQLNGQIANMREKFKAGPGSTSGIWGIEDYFGGPANNAFDTAANAARGNVGTTLGFTGGQLNTDSEAKRNIGPYIPQSSDWDATALDKIAQLEGLRDTAIRDSIQVLGGIPDANGNVAPIPQGADPLEYAKKTWGTIAAAPSSGQGGPPSILPPGGGNSGGPAPYAGPGPVAPLSASGATGANVVGTGQNAVPNPEGEALYNDYLKLWGANADDATIREWSKKIYGAVNPDVEAALQARREGKNINFYPGDGLLTKNVGADTGAAGAVADTSASPTGTFAANFGNAAGAGIPQWLAGKVGGNPDLTDIRFDTMNATNPNAAVTGQLAGGAAGSGAAELGALRAAAAFGRGAEWAPRIADTAYGAASGATGNPDNPYAALLGGGIGFAGGVGGRAAARGTGAAFRGVRNEAVRELSARGIPMTTGQILGNSGRVGAAIKGIEDRLTGIPIVGDMVNARRREGFNGFNRAAFNEARQPIGAAPRDMIRAPGVEALGQDVSAGYGRALDGVNVTADNPFVTDMTAALRAGTALPDPMAGRANYTLNTRVGNSFSPTGDLSGTNFQQSLRGLRRDARAVRSEPYGHDFGEVTGQAEDALSGLLDRQAPGVVPQYEAANRANSLYETVRAAVDKARNGSRSGETDVFTPSQLSDAASASARRFGNSQGTTRQPFYDLTRAGQDVLPSSVPDSGTAGRLLLSAALPAALGGGVGEGADLLSGGDGGGLTKGLAVGALLAAGGSRRGQQLLQTILLDRPDALVRIGNKINSRQALGGVLGAPLLLEAQR